MHETLEEGRLHVAVDLLIFTVKDGKLTLLLSRRTHSPFQGCWALPGRIVAQDESAEATAHRLLADMLPVKSAYLEQLYTFTALNRDPRGRSISISYMILLPWPQLENALAQPGVSLKLFGARLESGKLLLLSPDGAVVTEGDLAFDHGEIVHMGVTRLQGKIDYTDVSFRLLSNPASFSLSELQTIFEAVLNTSMDGSNFRRAIRSRYESAGFIEPTNQEKPQGRGRPAVLYRLVKRP